MAESKYCFFPTAVLVKCGEGCMAYAGQVNGQHTCKLLIAVDKLTRPVSRPVAAAEPPKVSIP